MSKTNSEKGAEILVWGLLLILLYVYREFVLIVVAAGLAFYFRREIAKSLRSGIKRLWLGVKWFVQLERKQKIGCVVAASIPAMVLGLQYYTGHQDNAQSQEEEKPQAPDYKFSDVVDNRNVTCVSEYDLDVYRVYVVKAKSRNGSMSDIRNMENILTSGKCRLGGVWLNPHKDDKQFQDALRIQETAQ